MRIKEVLESKRYSLSFEVFPPKTDAVYDSVRTATEEIAKLSPAFMSVTYGAGGGTSAYTLEIAQRIDRDFGVPSLAHLTYIGDSDVGKHCNFGCGVVVVNYDGEVKNRTTVGDFAFVGCNTNLVAPVRVGNGAYTAAATTVTKDVPDGALAVGRARQQNIEGWAARKL